MVKEFFELPYYHDYISPAMAEYLLQEARPVAGVEHLLEVGAGGGLENAESLTFLVNLYAQIKLDLLKVLNQRQADRLFMDQRTQACAVFNKQLHLDSQDADYQTVLGMEDADGRIVIGPKGPHFCQKGGQTVAPVPAFLQGPHVTLFGPPDSAKLAINAMNAYHRQLKGEPPIVAELLRTQNLSAKWGADNEDSKTPLRGDLMESAVNLTACFDGSLSFQDSRSQKNYALNPEHQSIPIKRFPGLALPCAFLFYQRNPLPLHLYDFALHIFRNWQNPEALVFYVPKIENEEEASYIHKMISSAETLLQAEHPEYTLGTIRVMLVLENPRAILRTHEMIDALYPYFVGASLGWHDYLASTARVFKEDANYHIPVKADPQIVIKYIKASHHLLADVVGSRGGIKIGGMYGILPLSAELESPSFQAALKGFFKDVITQFKRGLNGFWVAHPDFVRIGLALVEAWRQKEAGDPVALTKLVQGLLLAPQAQEIQDFIKSPDIEGLTSSDPNYVRSLLVANLKGSDLIANNHPDEVRYNIFQSLQYLADWLSGRGCVALPTSLDQQSVRVMDDLATAERSRWEVWHEVYHGRLSLPLLVQIAHEELHFIRKDQSKDLKIVQVKWDQETAVWYPIAMQIMLQLMTHPEPVEFATELLLPFTIAPVRQATDPWAMVQSIDAQKYQLIAPVARLHYFFERCGSLRFASELAQDSFLDLKHVQDVIQSFSVAEIIEAASFHGDIGEAPTTLDQHAAKEQALVASAEQKTIAALRDLGKTYQEKFGFKFLISAQGQSAETLQQRLEERLGNSLNTEVDKAREALWLITQKRILAAPLDTLQEQINRLVASHKVAGVSVAVVRAQAIQSLCSGFAEKNQTPVQANTLFELASLSKTLATAFAMEYFRSKGIDLASPVNSLLAQVSSPIRLRAKDNQGWSDAVNLRHLLSHTALNMHYVKGVSLDQSMPSCEELLSHPEKYGYPALEIVAQPGSVFQYSGGGFLVLEHLLERLEKQRIQDMIRPFFQALGLSGLCFEQASQIGCNYALGYFDSGDPVPGGRLQFPACAAGAMGTAGAMLGFLRHLEHAFHNLDGSGPIAHDTAVEMLYGVDKGAQAFMGCNMGCGVFLAEAGDNRLMIHQGANEGFRALYIHCFAGPDRGQGLVILCNSDNRAVPFIAELAQLLLTAFNISGIDYRQFQKKFDSSHLQQEQIVNLGYKQLIFASFLPTLPEAIVLKGPLDPLAAFNLLVKAEIVAVSNQRFAQAENLISPFLPRYDPNLFGRQGKVMDSWESARHNSLEYDSLLLRVQTPKPIGFVALSTEFHDGNQAEWVRLSGQLKTDGPWQEFLPKTAMQGHASLLIALPAETPAFTSIRVDMYPDGGLSRLGLYNQLPAADRARFKTPAQAQCQRFPSIIPKSHKPLTITYKPTAAQIQHNRQRCAGKRIDFASVAFGGQMLEASNEHYGPAVQLLSPFPPLHMFDGLESARSRTANHSEQVVIQLGGRQSIQTLVLDFSYFINNNPCFISMAAWVDGQWLDIVGKTPVKAYAGNKKAFRLPKAVTTEKILLRTFPDGGINRLHVYA